MKNKEFWKEIKEDLKIPILILFFIWVLTIISSVIFYKVPIVIHLGLYKNSSFWESFLINLHNSLIDVFLFGILFTVIAKKISWKREIQTYEDVISENRGLTENHLPNKLSQCIRRLNQYGVTDKLNLTKCHLVGANLERINNISVILNDSKLMGSNLEGAKMRGIILKGADLKGVNLKKCNLNSANLTKAKLRNIKCENTNCTGANFTETELLRAKLENSDFKSADFRGADFKEVSFKGSIFVDANFIGATNLDVNSLMEAKSLRKIKIETEVMVEIKNSRPDLLDN